MRVAIINSYLDFPDELWAFGKTDCIYAINRNSVGNDTDRLAAFIRKYREGLSVCELNDVMDVGLLPEAVVVPTDITKDVLNVLREWMCPKIFFIVGQNGGINLALYPEITRNSILYTRHPYTDEDRRLFSEVRELVDKKRVRYDFYDKWRAESVRN